MRLPSWRRSAALGTAALLLLAGGAAADPSDPDLGRLPQVPACSQPDVVTRSGAWAAVRTPRFEERPLGQGQDVVSYVVSPHDQRRVFVTNGTSVLRSLDAGCTWTEVYVLPEVKTDEQPLSVAGTRLRDLVVPVDPRAASRVLLVAQEVGGAPHVLISEDGTEDSFERRDNGLPATGEITDLEVSPSNPDFVFVSLRLEPASPAPDLEPPAVPLPGTPPLPDLPGVPGVGSPTEPDPRTAARGALYASVNGGADYEARLDPTDATATTSAIDDLITDPLAANQLWAIAGGVLRHSDDAGRTFRASVPSPREQAARGWHVTAVVVDAGPDRPRRVLAFTRSSAQDGPRQLTSTDAGVTFDETRAPGPVDSAVLVGADRRTLALSTAGGRSGVHVLRDGRFVDVTPLDSDRPFALTSDRTERATLHALAPGSLLRYVGPLVTPPRALLPPIGEVVQDEDLPPLGAGAFSPAADDLELEVGQSRTIDHRLDLPRRGTPLDLFVLVDTTISMQDDLPRVTRDVLSLVDRLRAAGVDLRVGLGEFKGQESTIGYRRVQGVGPDVEDFRSALAGLKADGFGLEMQLIALEQALTGAGEGPEDLVPAACKAPEKSPDRFVLDERRTAPPAAPAQQADFSPSHVKVVLTITDTVFLRPAGTPLTADCRVDTLGVARKYATAGVHQVGVGVDDVDNPRTAEDLLVGAQTTGTMQPGPTSCAPELQPSSRGPHPAVCRTAGALEPTLLALVESQSEPVGVTLAQSPPSAAVSVPDLPRVDLRRPSPVSVPVTYTCDDTGTHEGTLRVSVPEREVAALRYRLVCVPAPVPQLPPSAAVAAAPLVGLLPPAPLPPPAPPAQAVQPQVQTQPQAQAQTQVQSGTQDQEQAAAQLALALQSGVQEEGLTTQAMSAREVPDVVRLSLLAALTAAAGAVAVRRREAVAVRPSATRR